MSVKNTDLLRSTAAVEKQFPSNQCGFSESYSTNLRKCSSMKPFSDCVFQLHSLFFGVDITALFKTLKNL